MAKAGRPQKDAPVLTPEERARRLRRVRDMLAYGCHLPQVMERFGISRESARCLVAEAQADAEREERR